ncbi:MAG: putative invasin [Herbaspirillum sp.]|nr:putative invasin [Herbaspirillum sp.]
MFKAHTRRLVLCWSLITLQALPVLPVHAQSAPSPRAGETTVKTSARDLIPGQATVPDHSAAPFVRGKMGATASGYLQDWLAGQGGSARVSLDLSDQFGLRSGALDVLVPLKEDEHRLMFTQLGMRKNDGQITLNAGLGQRHFKEKWMFGYNAFYDRNISEGHSRVGIGAEAWTDFLKLSSNVYKRLSDWRQSRRHTDYDARPADGFDINLEGYLPRYPQWGGKLGYEQYFGNEVALFGFESRQRNPHAINFGVSYRSPSPAAWCRRR